MAELVSLQLQNGFDYSTSDTIRSYTEQGKTNYGIRLGNEAVWSIAEGSSFHNMVVRIHFKTDELGASSLSWGLKEQVLFYPAYENSTRKLVWDENGICYHYTNSSQKFQLTGVFKYAITTDPNTLIRSDFTYLSISDAQTLDEAFNETGYVIKDQIINFEQYDKQKDYLNLTGSCDVFLQPSTDYYLWLYGVQDVRNFFRLFMITGYWDPPLLTVESHGSAEARIDWDNGHTGIQNSTCNIGDTIHFYHIEEVDAPRDGYTFIGWNTKSDGRGTMYYPGDETTVTDSITFYAIWSANYTIEYEGNGATAGYVETTSHTEKIASQLASNTFARQHKIHLDGNGGVVPQETLIVNHVPDGWLWKEQNRSFKNEENIISLTSTPDDVITLDANWKMRSATLPQATREGYRLVDWNTTADGSGISYRRGSSIEPTQDMTLYAQWISDGSHGLSIFVKVDGQWKASIG